jgi:hypothetical protein
MEEAEQFGRSCSRHADAGANRVFVGEVASGMPPAASGVRKPELTVAKKKIGKKSSKLAGRVRSATEKKVKGEGAKARRGAATKDGRKVRPSAGERASHPTLEQLRHGTGRGPEVKRTQLEPADEGTDLKWIGFDHEHADRLGQRLATRSHEVIKRWAAERGAEPVGVDYTNSEVRPLLRLEFPGIADQTIKTLEWEQWFEVFDREELVFIYEEDQRDGRPSNYYAFARWRDRFGDRSKEPTKGDADARQEDEDS